MSAPKETKQVSANGLNALMKRYSEVQLATLIDTPPEGAQWLHEIKFDGYRLLGYVFGGASRLLTRNGKDWTNKFPSLSAALEKLPVKNAVLDMEAVMLDKDGKSRFQSLQAALGERGTRARIVAYVFDLLYIDDADLTQKPLLERKERLQILLKGNKLPLRYSGHVLGQGAEMFAKACETGLEGIISKEANAPYVAGRQRSWLKIKCSRRQEFIIVGFSDARKGERALGALYLAYQKNGVLQYAGKVGTGFSFQSARELAGRLGKIGVKTPVLSRSETVGLAAVNAISQSSIGLTQWTRSGLEMAAFAIHLFRACEKTKIPRKSIRSSQCKHPSIPSPRPERKTPEALC